ncbi:E3 SUMO-protein ligase KIAA1586-like [Mercenaria mercenaria]|uniref:E3 SUMO-protein ligase KIAA1586-like n=1 Tax=Mercenaria mercenaria TaxID=6596 RepID=UPI00234F2C2A|nr:E3 SUMO-protein ligase KIAA1586-like [Mercenaria mercenaria]
MFCTFCIKTSNECVFTTGCSNFKVETLNAHQESRGQQKAAGEHHAKSAPTHSKTSEAANCLLKLKQNEYQKLIIKFRTAHALAKSHQSFNFYNTICRLDKVKGLDVGKSYLNDKAAASFTKAIAEVTRQKVLKKLRQSPFFSFTIDGANDFTGEDLENIYVRTCIHGQIQDTFLYIGSAESATSRDIHNLIFKVFEEYGISDVFEKRLVGFCADGASNMQGLKSGLAALIREQQPYCIITHCLAHRLELAFKDAIKTSSTSKLYDKTLTLLIGLYYLYRRSPKMKKQLKNAFTTMEIKQVLPTRIGGTRWLPHMERAINAFLGGYRAIRAQLETGSHNNPKAEGLAKLASD